MTDFRVSVTIPIFNAAGYVRAAVESALNQPETGEVILAEDYSSDNSWEVCQRLAAEDTRIRLVRPADGKNHGCSASRNLAIRNSVCDYIAFLDADDFFLPNRFEIAKKMFLADPDLDGVYDAVEMCVEDQTGLSRWQAANKGSISVHTLDRAVAPEELYSALVKQDAGHFHINGFTLKRSALAKSGYLDEQLPLHGDEIFFIRLAATCRIAGGSLDVPVAAWRIHGKNRFSAPRPQRDVYLLRVKFWNILWEWGKTRLTSEQEQLLLQALLNDARLRNRFDRPFPKRLTGLQQRIQLILLPFHYPAVLLKSDYWRLFLPRSWRRN